MLYAFSRQLHTFVNRKLGSSLARQYTAIRSAQCMRHPNPSLLFFNFIIAKFNIGMRKIGRTTHHRNFFTCIFYLFAEQRPVVFVLHFNKTCIPFQPINIQLEASVIHSATFMVPSLHNACINALGNAAKRGI